MFGVTADVMPFPMFFIKRESRCDVCVGCVTCFLGNTYFQVGVMGWCFVVKMVTEPKYYAIMTR